MTNLHPHRSYFSRTSLLALAGISLLCTLLNPGVLHAQVTVPSTVALNMGTGIYTYSYSVMNNGPTADLAVVTLPVAPGSNLMNLTSPSGFSISFDSGVNLVSFLEDSDPATLTTFAPSTTRGLFSFTSRVGPATVTFEALDADGNTFTGTTVSPSIPEPGALSLLIPTLLAPVLLARRRRNASTSPN